MKVLGIIVLIAIVLFGLYFYFQPEAVNDWLRDKEIIDTPKVTRIYKWQDEQGKWHVSDSPPKEGVTYEMRDYRSDENILPLPPKLQEKD